MSRRTTKPFIRNAFTLVELLVVMAIISVLAAMLLPTLERSIEHARLVVCQNTERQLGLGVTLYAHDNGDRLPPSNPFHDWDTQPYLANTVINGMTALRPWGVGLPGKPLNLGWLYTEGYIRDKYAFYCPNDGLSHNPPQSESIRTLGASWPFNASWSNYLYNPHTVMHPVLTRVPQYVRLSSMPLTSPLLYDEVRSILHSPNRWNRLFPDLHVKTIESDTAELFFITKPLQWARSMKNTLNLP